jgi:hypothetical protein
MVTFDQNLIVGTYDYTVEYFYNSNFNKISFNDEFVVNKIDPTFETTNSTLSYTVNNLGNLNNQITSVTPGIFKQYGNNIDKYTLEEDVNPDCFVTIIPTVNMVGNHPYELEFIPEDDHNYNSIIIAYVINVNPILILQSNSDLSNKSPSEIKTKQYYVSNYSGTGT